MVLNVVEILAVVVCTVVVCTVTNLNKVEFTSSITIAYHVYRPGKGSAARQPAARAAPVSNDLYAAPKGKA